MLLGSCWAKTWAGGGQQGIVRCWNCLTNKCASGGVEHRWHLARLRTLDRELHLGLLGMLLDREE